MSFTSRREVMAGLGALSAGPSPPLVADAALDALLRSPPRDAATGPWRVPDETPEGAALRRAEPGAALARLKAVDTRGLSPRGRLEFDTVATQLELEARIGRDFPFGAAPGRPYVVDPRGGTHRLLETGLGGPDPAQDSATAEAYLAALRRLARNVDGETERLRADADAWGVILPQALLTATAAAVATAAALDPRTSALSRAAVDPAAAAAVIGAELQPALARQAEALRSLQPRSPAAGGASRWRDGEAYHALCLRLGTGTDLTPPRAEALAREAAVRLTAELDRRLRAEGLTEGGVGERLRGLMADPAGLYPDSGEGRDRAVADMNTVVAQALARTPRLVAETPAGPVAVARMSPGDEAAARAGYRQPTSRGGVYRVDLHAIRNRPAWTLPTVVCHETVPGHLLQLPVQAADAPTPMRVRAAPGYFEGWGVYAETLGAELDLYDRRDAIGHLQSLLLRLSRAIADAGVHRHGWTPERTRAELAALYGDGLFNSLAAEADRILTAPGAGGADALAWLEIARLRRLWRGDARAFHHAVLARGPYPPRFLERGVALG